MISKTFTYGLAGIDAYPVTIEVDVQRGIPSTSIVGLPDSAIKESRERVHAAIKNSGFDLRPQKVTVSLSPADTRKEGACFDLPIALGILSAAGHISSEHIRRFIFLGELSLDGIIRPVRGALSISLTADPSVFRGLILPEANAREAAVSQKIPVFPVNSLNEVIDLVSSPEHYQPYHIDSRGILLSEKQDTLNFSDVKGQTAVKRGLEIAAAGGHNCLLIGPPGSGKTMLARRIPTILPDLTLEEALETTRIHSVMGLLPPQNALVVNRPFRCPHHTCSDIALIGGGSIPRPGEVTLAHHGVLFLDELPEFSRNALESLRQPLEDHCVTVSRAAKTTRFPSKFMLVASMNPCPCGYATDPKKDCHCSPLQIQKYLSKISGPLLDRIDIHLEVPALRPQELLSKTSAEPSSAIKERAARARAVQNERFNKSGIFCNAQMSTRELKHFCTLTSGGENLLRRAIEEIGLSARAHDKILKVARTIADLAYANHLNVGTQNVASNNVGTQNVASLQNDNIPILPEHIAEAIQYRCLDRT